MTPAVPVQFSPCSIVAVAVVGVGVTIPAHVSCRILKNNTVLILHRFLRQTTELQNVFKLLYPRPHNPSDPIPTN